MEGCVNLVKHQMGSHVIPAFDPLQIPKEIMQTIDEEEEEEDDLMPKGKGRRKSAKGRKSEKTLLPVLKQLMRTTARMNELFDLFEKLVTSITVDDRLLLMLSPICLLTLTIDAGSDIALSKLQPIQLSSLSFLQAIFSKYEQHRSIIMEDIFALLLKLPTGKRQLRTFRLHYRVVTLGAEHQNIQNFTALVLLLLQSVVTKPSGLREQINSGQIKEGGEHGVSESFDVCTQLAHKFASQFLARCTKKEAGAEFRPFLQNMVDDLLAAFLLPEWPASEVLLEQFCVLLFCDLMNHGNVTKANSGSLKTQVDPQYYLQSVDLLGKVCTRLRKLSSLEGTEPSEFMDLAILIKKELEKAPPEDFQGCKDGEVATYMKELMRKKMDSAMLLDGGKKKRKRKPKKTDETPAVAEGAPTEGDGQIAVKTNEDEEASREGSKKRKSSVAAKPEANGHATDALQEDLAEVLVISNLDLANHLILNYLTDRAQKENWVRSARTLHLLRWISKAIEEDHPTKYLTYLESLLDMPAQTNTSDDLLYALPVESAMRINHVLALARPFCQSFDQLLVRLLALLGQDQATWRARVMKAFASIIECDPMLMAEDTVKQAVVGRFQDEAISVREAAVALVGRYILYKPGLFEKYYDALMERLVDKGISVRKTMVKIFRDVLLQQPTHHLRTEICRRLVERAGVVKEEDSVKDLIRDTFQEMWFLEYKGRESLVADEDPIVLPGSSDEPNGHQANLSRRRSTISDQARLEAVALQMVEVIAGLQNTDWLVQLLSGLLTAPGEGEMQKKDRVKQLENMHRRCNAIIDCLIDMLLRLDEGDSPPFNKDIHELQTPAKQLLAVISTAFVFSRANPNFLLKHVDTLLPYLKAENHLEKADEGVACEMIASMVALVIPHVTDPNQARMKEVARDLTQIIYKFGPNAIHAAVQCLANIATYITKDVSDILGLANTFYRVLKKFRTVMDFEKATVDVRSSVHRGLIVLGCVNRYYDFKSMAGPKDKILNEKTLASELTASNMVYTTYKILSMFLQRDSKTETSTVQALCSLFTGCMSLMLDAQHDGLIDTILKGPRNVVKLQALKSLREVLIAEENRIESGVARESMQKSGVSLQQRVKGDQDAEASIVGGVIQEHLDSIKELLFDADSALRSHAILLLGVLHRQGLVNPLQTLPTLIALQGDTCHSVRADAYRQILIENEKHPEFLPTRILEGICLSYQFQSNCFHHISAVVDEKDAGGLFAPNSCIFAPLYASSIRENRQRRFSFLRILLSLFDEKSGKDVRSSDKKRRKLSSGRQISEESIQQRESWDPRFLGYVSQILASLPYDVQEEPLFIIYHVSRQISLEGSVLLDEIRRLFKALGIKVESEEKAPNEIDQDRMETGEKEEEDSDADMDMIDPPMSEDEVLARLKMKCAAGMAFSLLLRLKFFLKSIYQLADAKCMEYKPQEATRSNERSLNKPDNIPDFELPQNLLIPDDDRTIKETLILQYIEFRRLMKGDPADFVLKVDKSTKGRGRKSASATTPKASGRRGSASSAKSKTPGAASSGRSKSTSKKKKKAALEESESEPDEEEEEWLTGGEDYPDQEDYEEGNAEEDYEDENSFEDLM